MPKTEVAGRRRAPVAGRLLALAWLVTMAVGPATAEAPQNYRFLLNTLHWLAGGLEGRGR